MAHVMAVIFKNELLNEIVLVNNLEIDNEQRKKPGGFGLPGGISERGESVEVAIRREVEEETDLKVEIVGKFELPTVLFPQSVKKIHRFLFVAMAKNEGNLDKKVPQETNEWLWTNVSVQNGIFFFDNQYKIYHSHLAALEIPDVIEKIKELEWNLWAQQKN